MEGKEVALRHRQLGAVRHGHHRRELRRGERHARFVHADRRHGAARQHHARRSDLRRRRRRHVRHADLRRAGGVHRRADGRPHAGIPRQEDRGVRREDGDAGRARVPARSSWCSPASRSVSPDFGTSSSGNPVRTACPKSSTPTRRAPATTARRSPASPPTRTWYNTTLGIAMLVGRFLIIIPMLALAGNLARKKHGAAVARHLPGDDAAVRDAARRRDRHRRRADVLSRAQPRPDRRALPDATRGSDRSERASKAGFTRLQSMAKTQTLQHLGPRAGAQSRARRFASASSIRAGWCKNPVMFVVEVGAVLTTVLLVRDIVAGGRGIGFELQITLWLWLTVLFANLAEAMAEGRGKAQADTLRKSARPRRSRTDCSPTGKTENGARAARCARATSSSSTRASSSPPTARSSKASRRWTSRRSPANRRRSFARRRRSLGRHRRHARAVGPDRRPRDGEPGRDVPRPHDRAGRRRRAAEDAERDRPQHPAGRADDRVPVRGRHAAAVRDLLRARRSRCSCWSRCWSA